MLKEKIIQALKQLEIETEFLGDNTSLHADLWMDSQEIIELMCCLEKILSSKLPDKFITHDETIGTLAGKLTELSLS